MTQNTLTLTMRKKLGEKKGYNKTNRGSVKKKEYAYCRLSVTWIPQII